MIIQIFASCNVVSTYLVNSTLHYSFHYLPHGGIEDTPKDNNQQ